VAGGGQAGESGDQGQRCEGDGTQDADFARTHRSERGRRRPEAGQGESPARPSRVAQEE
jgi:hypothetical protein